MDIEALRKELEKLIGQIFCWDRIKEMLLAYGNKAKINTGYGIHLIQVFVDNREIIFDLEDDIIHDIYL